MKKKTLNIVATLSLIAALTVSVFAGLGGNLTADIPFDFHVNDVEMPAGNYAIYKPDGIAGLLRVRSTDNPEIMGHSPRQTLSLSRPRTPRLVFHKYGNHYFLVTVEDGSAKHTLPTSKAERATAKSNGDYLTMNLKPEIITVFAR